MNLLAAAIGGVLGALIGAAAGHSLAVFGLLAGAGAGFLLMRVRDLAVQVQELRRELGRLRHDAPAARPASPTPVSAPSPSPAPLQPAVAPDIVRQRAVRAVKRWFTEGNVPVKVGMLVLFAGVGALLRYAQRQGWLTLPIGTRLIGLAIIALAALWFGWRERVRRRAFGLTLQGGAIGILVMTVFGAFRLYHLLPASVSFALLLVLVAATCALAVSQDSIALAVLALLAGFAAPILSSTGQGSHVVLFSYYALFNLAIFAIAWARSWRLLNLLGFAFTFLIGIAWGVLRYEPRLFGSVEPFLIVFFAIYLAIPVINGLRQDAPGRDPVDGTLVFGNPLLAFSLQAGLLEGARLPLAGTAVLLAVLYALLAWWLIHRHRVLGESLAVLAAAFITLAVPLALSAWATACVFALEGAGLLWLGLRQQRLLQQCSGVALQALAAMAFLYSLFGAPMETLAVLNSSCLSALLIAGAGLISAWLLTRHAHTREYALPMYLWGLLWWCGACGREIHRFVPDTLHSPAILAFLELTALLASLAWYRLALQALAWTAAVAFAIGIIQIGGYAITGLLPWDPWPLAALGGFAVCGYAALRLLRNAAPAPLGIAHACWIWVWTLALALTAWRASADTGLGDGWQVALTLLPLLLAWALAALRPAWIAPPLTTRFDEWRLPLSTSLAVVAAFAFLYTLLSRGSAAPWPWLPVANPLELLQLAMLVAAACWLGGPAAPRAPAWHRPALLALGAFLFVTAATLRGVHQLGHQPWNLALWSTTLAQTSLTIVWSVLGLLGWVLGSRRGSRALWIAGAVLMGVVLAKLLLVDRSHLGSVLGIVSFIAYGLLCTLIGYLAPAPPRAAR
jgi:uncharacterized membrane protein